MEEIALINVSSDELLPGYSYNMSQKFWTYSYTFYGNLIL